MTRRIMRAVGYAAVLAVAIGGVYLVTSKPATATVTPGPSKRSDSSAAGSPSKTVVLTDADARRIGVTFAAATLEPLGKEVRTVGQITFDETRVRAISPKIDGWVETLIVNATGQSVTVGQRLLTIYAPMLVSAQEELLLARQLRRDVSGADSSARQRADELLASSRRRLAYWDIPAQDIAEIERTGLVRKTLTLRASAGGFVLEKNVIAGQKIMAGDVLYRVADLSTVWIEGEVFEQDLASVRVGQSVHAELEAMHGASRLGRIAFVYPTLNADTRTARVRVVLPNSDFQLKPGMYATLRIAGTARAGVLTVPRSAVLSTGERSIVFVRDAAGRLVPREVALGMSSDDRVEITRGVTAGEIVVSSATFLVDAESNLGTALGGMGNMPGMDMTTAPKPLDTKRAITPTKR
ncbi:MAG: efflux RND transporter periplasmic adaptor subunit [bacterium]